MLVTEILQSKESDGQLSTTFLLATFKHLFAPCHGNLCSGVTIISFSFRLVVIVILYFQSNKCRINERFYFAIFISKHLRTDVILFRVRFQLHINSISVLASYYSGRSLTELKVTINKQKSKVIGAKRGEILQGSKFKLRIRDKPLAEY